MRLFFAVNFSEREKDALVGNVARLKKMCSRGNFTDRNNLHITLAFLGEVDRAELPKICAAAKNVGAAPLEFTVSGAGTFGDIVWLGVDKVGAEALSRLANALRLECDKNGISYDKKPFSPHLTLCRGAVFSGEHSAHDFSLQATPLKKAVLSFELMESTRIGGRLTYKKIFSRKLGE